MAQIGIIILKLRRNGKVGHQRPVVYGIVFHLAGYFQRIAQDFGQVGKEGVHLGSRFQPFLFGITHTGRVVKVLSRAETNQAVVRLRILLVYKMDIIRGNQLDLVLGSQFSQYPVYFLLARIGSTVGGRVAGRVPLQFQIIIIAEKILKPKERLLRLVRPPVHNVAGQFPPQTSRTDNQILVVFLQQSLVDTRTVVKTLRPRDGNHLYQVLVALQGFGKHNQMPSPQVLLAVLPFPAVAGAITFATEDRLEQFAFGGGNLIGKRGKTAAVFLRRAVLRFERVRLFAASPDGIQMFAVLLLYLVIKFLDAEHIAVVGHGKGFHAVRLRLFDKRIYRSLSVQQRVLSVYMQMHERFHTVMLM
ncbi:hypothetical protein Barb4_04706 [Bacteroidales bacterium Barb4]|nr:hypothetical protein Barb4_04706 [Bacteroidales bacterium Barb4]